MSNLFIDNIMEHFRQINDNMSFSSFRAKEDREAVLQIKTSMRDLLENYVTRQPYSVGEPHLSKDSSIYDFATRHGYKTDAILYVDGYASILKFVKENDDKKDFDEFGWPTKFLRDGFYFVGLKSKGKYKYYTVDVKEEKKDEEIKAKTYSYICDNGLTKEKTDDVALIAENLNSRLQNPNIKEIKSAEAIYGILKMESAVIDKESSRIIEEKDRELRERYRLIQQGNIVKELAK